MMEDKIHKIIFDNIQYYENLETDMLKKLKKSFQQYKDRIKANLEIVKKKSIDEYNDIIEDINKNENNIVIGDVVEIKADPEVYKNLLNTARDEKWVYNGITIVPSDNKWLIMFY